MIRSLWLTAIVALALFLFFFDLLPGSDPTTALPPTRNAAAAHALAQAGHGLAILSASSFGDFDPAAGRWLDLAGFRAADDDGGRAWAAALPVAKRVAAAQLRGALGGRGGEGALRGGRGPRTGWEVFANVSGYVRGPWRAVRAGGRGAHSASLRTSRWNITGETGELHVSLVEKGLTDVWDGLSVRGVSAALTLRQDVQEHSSQVSLYGLHILETGSILLVTSSEKLVQEP
jgi:transmembrane E3 ubiquitin-protein ligase